MKMFGLAGIAVLMAMAFAGAGSAMAESTALCNVDPGTGATEVCPAGHLVTHVHETSVSQAKLLTTFFTVSLDVLFLGDTVGELNSPLVVRGHFTFTNAGSCTAAEPAGTEAKLSVLKLGHELADVTVEYEEHVVCGASLDCTYNGEGLEGHALGPLLSIGNGEIRFEEKAIKKVAGGLLCPKTSKLDLLLTPLTATYLTN